MKRKTFLRSLVCIILLLVLIPMIIIWLRRPVRVPEQSRFFPGVVYHRQVYDHPHPLVLHILEIDLTTADLRFFVTPGINTTDDDPYRAQTTTEFMKTYQVQAAINANFFYPFHETTPWDYYPKRYDPVTAVGLVISDGVTYSSFNEKFPVLCLAGRSAQILQTDCPEGTQQAVAGNHLLIWDGNAQAITDDEPYPRTVVALNEEGDTMWWLVVDGKQRGYSEGATLAELADLLSDLGATTALNLDGGGSTSMAVMNENDVPMLLNSPVHTRIPLRQRPVAVHLGLLVSSADSR